MNDYDLENSTLLEGLQLSQHTQIPGPSEAQCGALCFAPPMPYFAQASSQTLLLVRICTRTLGRWLFWKNALTGCLFNLLFCGVVRVR